MKLFTLLLLFLTLAVPTASGDVCLSKTYYSGATVVHEEVFLHNVDYVNIVSSGLGGMAGISSGVSADETGSTFSDYITMKSNGGVIQNWANVQAEKELAWGREFIASKENSIGILYGLGTGNANAGCSNPFATIEEDLTLIENIYTGTIQASPHGLGLDGSGLRLSEEDTDSGFEHDIQLTFADNWHKIDSEFSSVKEVESKATPVIYAWDAHAIVEDASKAGFSVNMRTVAGDRDVKMNMVGSTSMPDLLDPNNPPNESATIKPIKTEDDGHTTLEDLLNTIVTEELYMSFNVDL